MLALASAVGPLFPHGLGSAHTCTASVVATSTGDVIATAAHCLSGTGVGVAFVPGYRSGTAPFGVWTVTGVYAAHPWITHRDPAADIAFLTVAPAVSAAPSRATLQSIVGASTLAPTPLAGTPISALGYAMGRNDLPLTCTGVTTTTDGFPTLACGSFPTGSSGAPWLTITPGGPARLVGVIGGLHQGGCRPEVSFSAPFSQATASVLRRAVARARPDTLPAAGANGC
jgi:hypothetical protein